MRLVITNYKLLYNMCRAVILLSTTKTNILPHELILQIRKDHSDYRMNQMGKDLHSKA